MKSKFLRNVIVTFVVLTLLVMGWTWLTLHWTFSEGERVGYVQKLSKKGWLCKTWEGELALVTMPGAIPEKFSFTIPDDATARRVNALAGERVVLNYQQHKFIPTSCFGDTEYFVVNVSKVREANAPTVPLPNSPQLTR
ncbi:MAG: hypothetical protein GZ085_00460 [Sulfuriferula multivorans]|uniref:6-phosphogluconate dehydrogenase n=1 Tax=Sulfuriferula multivorans TaxID=1559896 RepID=A0A7C9P489_9PROT|nr:hypothetical protein [Sulfuriferula multivorans]